MLEYIKLDLYRYTGDFSIKSFFKAYFSTEGFRFTVWLRLCAFYRKSKVAKYTLFIPARIVYNHYRIKYGYDIPYAIDIGPGLLLFHLNGIIVSANSIGKNATLSHGVTIGGVFKNGKHLFPTLGDNVYLAPGSNVIGGVKIGNNVIIGTNAVVTHDVNDNSVLIGMPAKVIKHIEENEYVVNPVP